MGAQSQSPMRAAARCRVQFWLLRPELLLLQHGERGAWRASVRGAGHGVDPPLTAVRPALFLPPRPFPQAVGETFLALKDIAWFAAFMGVVTIWVELQACGWPRAPHAHFGLTPQRMPPRAKPLSDRVLLLSLSACATQRPHRCRLRATFTPCKRLRSVVFGCACAALRKWRSLADQGQEEGGQQESGVLRHFPLFGRCSPASCLSHSPELPLDHSDPEPLATC